MLHGSILYIEYVKSNLSNKILTFDMLVDWRYKNNVFEYIFGHLFHFNLYLYKELYKIIRPIKTKQNTLKEETWTMSMTLVKANISIRQRWIKPLTRNETEIQSRFTIKPRMPW